MRLPAFLQPRVLGQVVRAVVSPPYRSRYPQQPHVPVAGYRGRPRFDEAGCIGCGACAQVCPANCIDVVDDLQAVPPVRRLVQHLDVCIWCGQCERHCPTRQGIRMSNEYDCVGFAPEDFEESVTKELVLCEICGEVIGTADALRWLARRLGPHAFANPTLMMMTSRALGFVGRGLRSASDETARADRLAIQCAKCRRKTALAA